MADMEHEDLDMAKPQMLEAGKISVAVNDFLQNPYASWDEAREMIKNVWNDLELSKLWIEKVIPEHRHLPLYEWDGIKDRFDAILINEYQKTRQAGGNLSTIGYSYFGSQASRQPRNLLVDELFAMGMLPGSCMIITGVPGSGKTDFAVSEVYRCAVKQPNVQVIHNISIKNEPENSHYCAKLSESLERMILHSLKGVQETGRPYITIWIMDEAQVSRSRTRSTSNIALAQQQVTLLLRKLGGYQVLIYQQNNPPMEVRDFATHWANKVSRTHQDWVDYKINSPALTTGQLKIRGVLGWEQRKQKGMEYYEYDTFAISSMTVDIWPLKLFNFASAKGMLKTAEYYQALLDFIAMQRGEVARDVVLTKEQEVELACRIYDNLISSADKKDQRFASYRFLAHAFGWDRDKVLDSAAQDMRRSMEKHRMKDLPVEETDNPEAEDEHDGD